LYGMGLPEVPLIHRCYYTPAIAVSLRKKHPVFTGQY
jgi:hypothetical protein